MPRDYEQEARDLEDALELVGVYETVDTRNLIQLVNEYAANYFEFGGTLLKDFTALRNLIAPTQITLPPQYDPLEGQPFVDPKSLSVINPNLNLINHEHATRKLSGDQELAWAKLKIWVYNDKPYFVLKGFAGTGKTFLMQLMAELKLRMYFCAPTNKAAKVLGVSVKSVAKTIYSLLGLRMEQVEDKLVLTEGRDHPYFPAGAIIVIDEASMLNEQLCTILRKVQLAHRIKILVVGDPIQIPPVGERRTLAWKFTDDVECRATLKEQMRFDNQILALSERLRECIKNKDWTSPLRSDHSEVEGVWKYKNEDQFERSILRSIKTSEDCLQNKVMAWRNKTVNHYNRVIRRHLGFTEEYCVGDIILLAEPLEDEDGNLMAHTDDEFTVTGVDHSEITVDQENVPVWVLQVKGDKSFILNVPEDQDVLDRILSQKAAFAKRQKAQFRTAAWKNFWNTKKLFNKIRYGYGLTAHRAQGSTYTNVWVDQVDVLSNSNKREAFSCLYVISTRPTTTLHTY
jgi:exodeoxyribonuclease-5